MSSVNDGSPAPTRRKLNLINQESGEIPRVEKKYVTPQNLTAKGSLERQSEAASTKESNQIQSMKKISRSIDRLRMKRKMLGNHPLSVPTDNRDESLRMKATGRLSRFELTQTPKLIVSKQIENMNLQFDDVFKYTEKDIEMLSQHPLIRRRVTNWGETLSPDYLLDLKKKQRQIEYWKHRVRNDFKPALDLIQKHQKEKEMEMLQHKLTLNQNRYGR
mmetsp:Transcript_24162/g.27869  ORF Transcript_24162/g.27869 Transcript_24162/m.27869 type:complete len:218 (-) Transcript_24162:116-769(-)